MVSEAGSVGTDTRRTEFMKSQKGSLQENKTNRNFSQNVVPQGPFGQTKSDSEPEGRPAEAFWADEIIF